MEETGASGGETTVGVTLGIEHLSWLAEAVAGRGGQVILEMRPGALRRSVQIEPCPLTGLQQEAVRVLVEEDSWEEAAKAAGITVGALRSRVRAACRRLGVGTEGRLVALCLTRGWVTPAER